MFTGLIEEIGRILYINRRGQMINLSIEAKEILDDVKTGDSISINGTCLTVTAVGDTSFTVQAVAETLSRTTLDTVRKGDAVNLERSLRLGDRLGGHLVQGHVDGIGRIVSKKGTADNVEFGISPEPELERYIAEKGSITVDGISLTVTYVRKGEFGVSVIPHTLRTTTLNNLMVGDKVNLETDIIAKYVEKLSVGKENLTINHLKDLGF